MAKAMPQTSLKPVANLRVRGVTFIEMCVIVTILLIMAALIEPNYARIKEGQNQRAFVSALASEVKRAKVTAISTGRTTTLQYDQGQQQITLNQPSTDTSDPNQFVPLTELQNQQTQPIHTVQVPSTVTLGDFKLGQNNTDASDWKINFYLDGRCDAGGVRVDINGASHSLVIDENGNASYVDGPLPDTSNDVWQAGQIVFRTGGAS